MILFGKMLYSFCYVNLYSPFAIIIRKYFSYGNKINDFAVMNSVMVKFVVLGGIMNSFLGDIYYIFMKYKKFLKLLKFLDH